MPLLHHVACALCGEDKTRQLFRPRNSPGPVVQCTHCGLIYVTPREDTRALIADGPVLADQAAQALTSNDLGALASCWELPLLHTKESEFSAIRRNASLAFRYIDQYATPPGRLLDYGCGGGFFLRVAADRMWETYGLEPLVGHALYARAKSGARIITDTLRESTFPAAFFDVITAFQVFEHLPDPNGVLANLRHSLKPGGLLLIEVPNFATWSVRLLGKRHRHFVQDHLYFFSPKTLDALVRKHGFKSLIAYQPKRYMTVRHLFVDWGERVLGAHTGQVLEQVLRKTRIQDSLLAVSTGDIMALLACKR